MIKWKYELNISTEFKQCKRKEITIQKLSEIIINKLNILRKQIVKNISDDYEQFDCKEKLYYLIDYFTSVDNVDNFDLAMSDLYDFADEYRIWIMTR